MRAILGEFVRGNTEFSWLGPLLSFGGNGRDHREATNNNNNGNNICPSTVSFVCLLTCLLGKLRESVSQLESRWATYTTSNGYFDLCLNTFSPNLAILLILVNESTQVERECLVRICSSLHSEYSSMAVSGMHYCNWVYTVSMSSTLQPTAVWDSLGWCETNERRRSSPAGLYGPTYGHDDNSRWWRRIYTRLPVPSRANERSCRLGHARLLRPRGI